MKYTKDNIDYYYVFEEGIYNTTMAKYDVESDEELTSIVIDDNTAENMIRVLNKQGWVKHQ